MNNKSTGDVEDFFQYVDPNKTAGTIAVVFGNTNDSIKSKVIDVMIWDHNDFILREEYLLMMIFILLQILLKQEEDGKELTGNITIKISLFLQNLPEIK
jgi:hypothetical protein